MTNTVRTSADEKILFCCCKHIFNILSVFKHLAYFAKQGTPPHIDEFADTALKSIFFTSQQRNVFSENLYLLVPLLHQYGKKRSATARQTCIPSLPEDVLISIFCFFSICTRQS